MGSNPGWSQGFVPTPAQWAAAFANKQDQLAYTPLNQAGGTMQGPLITTASIATAAGFNLPPGVAPTTPNPGDVWNNGSGLFVQLGTGAATELATYSGSAVQSGQLPSATTSSGTAVMAGLGGTCTVTPVASSRVLSSFTGYILNNSGTGAVSTNMQLAFGTGVAPLPGAAVTGTLIGASVTVQPPASSRAVFCLIGIALGLTPGIPYWFDIVFSVSPGGNSEQIPRSHFSAFEM